MKRLLFTFATLLGIGIVCVLSVGWLLAHPVQTGIGNPPADLNAQPVTFASDSGANVTVGGLQSRILVVLCYFCLVSVRIV